MTDRPEYIPSNGPFQVTVQYCHLLKGGNKSAKMYKHTLKREIPRGLLQSASLGKINGLNLLGKWTREEVGCKAMVVISEILRVDEIVRPIQEDNNNTYFGDDDIPF